MYLLRAAGSAEGGGTAESGQGYMQHMLWACLSVSASKSLCIYYGWQIGGYLLRVAGSARGGGTAESGQGDMQKMLWACLSV